MSALTNTAVYKMPFWTAVINGGDGSVHVKYFTTQALAEAYMEKDEERFCDDIIPPRDVMIDDEPNWWTL